MASIDQILGSDFKTALDQPVNPSSIEVHGLIRTLAGRLHKEAGFVPSQEVKSQAGQKVFLPFTHFEMIEIGDDDDEEADANPGEISRLSVFIPATDSSKLAVRFSASTFNNKGEEVKGTFLKGRIVRISAFRPDEVRASPSLSVESYDRCEAIIPQNEESMPEIRDFSFSKSRMRAPVHYAWSQAEQSVSDFIERLGLKTTGPSSSAKWDKEP